MDLLEAMNARHSVRQYQDKPLDAATVSALTEEIALCNQESGLHIQLVRNEPKAFRGFLARYGKFSGVKNYFALVGAKSPAPEEPCGYYGERLTLRAQQLGLNTCWVALSYSKVKGAFSIGSGEKLCAVIAVGYGTTQGVAHRSKPSAAVMKATGPIPEWFRRGIDAALLAPTAVNQQKFLFTLQNGQVIAEPGRGFYTKIDLGIAKYHFELGAGTDHFRWA